MQIIIVYIEKFREISQISEEYQSAINTKTFPSDKFFKTMYVEHISYVWCDLFLATNTYPKQFGPKLVVMASRVWISNSIPCFVIKNYGKAYKKDAITPQIQKLRENLLNTRPWQLEFETSAGNVSMLRTNAHLFKINSHSKHGNNKDHHLVRIQQCDLRKRIGSDSTVFLLCFDYYASDHKQLSQLTVKFG